METSEPPSNEDLQALEGKITLLTELTMRVESLRQTPTYLRPTAAGTAPVAIPTSVQSPTQTALIRQSFQHIKEFSDKMQSEPVQDVLKSVKESQTKDKNTLNFRHRRKNLKREYVAVNLFVLHQDNEPTCIARRPPSPESPQPYRSFQPKTSPFPPDDVASAPLQMENLVDFIQSYNRSNPFRLHIWTATPRLSGQKLPDQVIVRFTIRDVVTIFLTVGSAPPDSAIVVEGATAFGPREKVRRRATGR